MKSNKVENWNRIRDSILVPMFAEQGIYGCEIRLNKCLGNMFTGFAHRHKRVAYYKHPTYLGDFNQVVIACQNCHSKIESNKELTKEVFLKLRGEDNLPLDS